MPASPKNHIYLWDEEKTNHFMSIKNRRADGIKQATITMKKITLITITLAGLMVAAACSSSRSLMPTAVNTVKSTSFNELNLTSNDYDILDRIEAQSTIFAKIDNNSYTVYDEENTFRLFFKKKNQNEVTLVKYEGVMRAGYLSRDYATINIKQPQPEEIARRIAIYRLINLVQEQGGDGIIEPVIATNVEETKSSWNSTTIAYRTTVSGKIVKLKTSK